MLEGIKRNFGLNSKSCFQKNCNFGTNFGTGWISVLKIAVIGCRKRQLLPAWQADCAVLTSLYKLWITNIWICLWPRNSRVAFEGCFRGVSCWTSKLRLWAQWVGPLVNYWVCSSNFLSLFGRGWHLIFWIKPYKNSEKVPHMPPFPAISMWLWEAAKPQQLQPEHRQKLSVAMCIESSDGWARQRGLLPVRKSPES